jgi:oligopeptidase B
MMLEDDPDYFLAKNRDFKLFTIKDEDIGKGNGVELLVKPDDGQYFEDMDIFKDYLIIYYKKHLKPYVLLYNILTQERNFIEIDKPGEIHPGLNKDFLAKSAIFEYSSPVEFKRKYELNFETKKLIIKQETKYNGKKFNKNDYEVTTLYIPSSDGELIPVTLFHLKGIKLDRKNKLLLTGYGAYGLNLELNYDSVNMSAVDKGWIMAFAHIRGGNEKGKEWHESGKLTNKHMVIEDYLAVAYGLVQMGYTHPNYLAGYGQSSGGAVIAQAINRKPDLFRAVVLSHPFVDILTTLLDESLPLTIPDYQEYGNPYESKRSYSHIQSLSPYENISHQEYPGIYLY